MGNVYIIYRALERTKTAMIQNIYKYSYLKAQIERRKHVKLISNLHSNTVSQLSFAPSFLCTIHVQREYFCFLRRGTLRSTVVLRKVERENHRHMETNFRV